MKVELIDVYDKNKEKTGKTYERGKYELNYGEYHLVAVIMLRDENKFLITKRHPSKMCGLMWEFTGGAVQAGENSIDAAVRELREETGVVTSKENIKYVDTMLYKEASLFLDVYIVNKHVEVDELFLQAEEVVDAKKVTNEELIEMNKKGVVTKLDWEVFQTYLKNMQQTLG